MISVSNIKQAGLIQHWEIILYCELFHLDIDHIEHSAHIEVQEQSQITQLLATTMIRPLIFIATNQTDNTTTIIG
ncbi:unnamed protein product, partial [Medioppia subpectinata]